MTKTVLAKASDPAIISQVLVVSNKDPNRAVDLAGGVNLLQYFESILADTVRVSVNYVVSDNSYPALFMTGNVGIGVSEPEVALHIMGDIRTVDYEGIESEVYDLNDLEIDSLTVFDDSDMFDVSAQRVTVDTLVFSNTIDFDFSNVNVANLSLDVSGITSVNILNDITTLNNSTGTLEVLETLLTQKGYIGRVRDMVRVRASPSCTA